jgi:YD repeat-containing protein
LRERIETTYDPLTGKKSLERTLAFEGASWVEKRRQSFGYDAEGRLQTVTHADSEALHYAYDAADRIASVRDENHTTPNTVYAYDPAGRMETVTQTLTGAPGGVIITRYAYDLHGNLVSVTDPNGNITRYTFDDFGQLLRQRVRSRA